MKITRIAQSAFTGLPGETARRSTGPTPGEIKAADELYDILDEAHMPGQILQMLEELSDDLRHAPPDMIEALNRLITAATKVRDQLLANEIRGWPNTAPIKSAQTAGRYKSDADIAAEFNEPKVRELKLPPVANFTNPECGMLVVDFPSAGESVAGGSDFAVEYFHVKPNPRIPNAVLLSFRTDHWYPEPTYQWMLHQITQAIEATGKKVVVEN